MDDRNLNAFSDCIDIGSVGKIPAVYTIWSSSSSSSRLTGDTKWANGSSSMSGRGIRMLETSIRWREGGQVYRR
jgi:hypothetical protein